MKKLISYIILFFAFQLSFAQNFQGKISNAAQNGLHKIEFSPDVVSAMENNVNHVRIFDAKNKEVEE